MPRALLAFAVLASASFSAGAAMASEALHLTPPLFREQARERFVEEGRDPDDEDALNSAIFRERKMWIRERTTELGSERAEYWGWTNIYTYSKSLAEQILAETEMMTLTSRDWNAFAKSLDNSEKSRPKLTAAMKRHREWQKR